MLLVCKMYWKQNSELHCILISIADTLALLPSEEPVVVPPAAAVHELAAPPGPVIIEVSGQVSAAAPHLLAQSAEPRLGIHVLEQLLNLLIKNIKSHNLYLCCTLLQKRSGLLDFLNLFKDIFSYIVFSNVHFIQLSRKNFLD